MTHPGVRPLTDLAYVLTIGMIPSEAPAPASNGCLIPVKAPMVVTRSN